MSKRWLFLKSIQASISYKCLAVIFLAGIPAIALATPSALGVFTGSNTVGQGTYTTASGSKGTYIITRGAQVGYSGYEILPRENGLQIVNKSSQGDTTKDKDKFEYTITLTPENPNEIHNILIAQAPYDKTGNSEIAKQTLSYVKNANNPLPARAAVISNPSVAYFYNAMGDYFMGSKNSDGTLRSGAEGNNPKSNPQLRLYTADAERLKPLYYYNILSLEGSGTAISYTPTIKNKVVSLKSGSNGVLPSTPTINRIIKELSDPDSYPALNVGSEIANGSSYVSFGIENAVSEYVIKVENAKSVTLTYEGIMNGNIGVNGGVLGETYNEWITFGVSSEPTYKFSGTVFNDNGGIDDTQADAQQTAGIYNNTSYFNGVLNTGEKGISGSTINLVNCSAPSTVYATTTTDANGDYRIDIAQSLLPAANVCLTETTTSAAYPIATSPSSRTVTISSATKDYPNQNFGRVIVKNAPLVLEKFQFANQCNLKNLVTDGTAPDPYTKDPISSANANVAPMNCIAYKLTATNRANLPIDNIVIQDLLAKKGINGAQASSFLIDNDKRTSSPAPAVSFTDGLINGENGTIKTAAFVLAAKKSRSFYFNTKYGSTQSP